MSACDGGTAEAEGSGGEEPAAEPAAAAAAAETDKRRKGWLGMSRKEERRRNFAQRAWVLPPIDVLWVGGWVGLVAVLLGGWG